LRQPKAKRKATKVHLTEELFIFSICVVLVSRNNTIFYGESIPKIFASFALDKYVHIFSVHSLSGAIPLSGP
jgi:hypothetical protein